MSQEQLKPLLPPTKGARIWGDYFEERWRCHLPPDPSFQRRWDQGSRRIAAVLIIQDAWRQYLADHLEDGAARPNIKDLWKSPFNHAGEVMEPQLGDPDS